VGTAGATAATGSPFGDRGPVNGSRNRARNDGTGGLNAFVHDNSSIDGAGCRPLEDSLHTDSDVSSIPDRRPENGLVVIERMPTPSRFLELRSPLHLLSKMDADFTFRLRLAPIDAYAAFDFFAAANQLPEWLGRARCAPGTPRNGYDQTLRVICAELANGAKHFTLNSATQEVRADDVPDRSAIGGSHRGGSLLITLDADAARALKRSHPVISALELAGLVLAYWKTHPMIARAEKRLK
jgi:hypothetical protein